MLSLVNMLLMIIVILNQCLAKFQLMPFHIVNNGAYIIQTKTNIKYNKKEYNNLIIKFSINDNNIINNIQFRLNNKAEFRNSVSYPIQPSHIVFHVKTNQIKLSYKRWFRSKKYKVNNCWVISRESSYSPATRTTIPIKSALQRLQVIVHDDHYFKSVIHHPLPVSTMEDAITLSAISMLIYHDDLKTNVAFYGGKIIKIGVLQRVDLLTHLSSAYPSLINVGPLKFFAWKFRQIFVICIRGTHGGSDNWPINFDIAAKKFRFDGYGVGNVVGDVHSGMYDVMEAYIAQFMRIFDAYNNEKRIILTGHSLGSGLAQMFLLHLLNALNKHDLPDNVQQIIYGDCKCSLEIMSFGGIAIMDKTIANKLKDALDEFNKRANNPPSRRYSAMVYYKQSDPVAYFGQKGFKFVKQILSKTWDWTATQLFFKTKVTKITKALALNGLSDVSKYTHFGKQIIVGSSPYNSIKEAFAKVFSHAEYLEAQFYDFKKYGVQGFNVHKK